MVMVSPSYTLITTPDVIFGTNGIVSFHVTGEWFADGEFRKQQNIFLKKNVFIEDFNFVAMAHSFLFLKHLEYFGKYLLDLDARFPDALFHVTLVPLRLKCNAEFGVVVMGVKFSEPTEAQLF